MLRSIVGTLRGFRFVSHLRLGHARPNSLWQPAGGAGRVLYLCAREDEVT
jgi:hypothetical protein